MREIDLNDIETDIDIEALERGYGRPVERYVWLVIADDTRFKWLLLEEMDYEKY